MLYNIHWRINCITLYFVSSSVQPQHFILYSMKISCLRAVTGWDERGPMPMCNKQRNEKSKQNAIRTPQEHKLWNEVSLLVWKRILVGYFVTRGNRKSATSFLIQISLWLSSFSYRVRVVFWISFHFISIGNKQLKLNFRTKCCDNNMDPCSVRLCHCVSSTLWIWCKYDNDCVICCWFAKMKIKFVFNNVISNVKWFEYFVPSFQIQIHIQIQALSKIFAKISSPFSIRIQSDGHSRCYGLMALT